MRNRLIIIFSICLLASCKKEIIPHPSDVFITIEDSKGQDLVSGIAQKKFTNLYNSTDLTYISTLNGQHIGDKIYVSLQKGGSNKNGELVWSICFSIDPFLTVSLIESSSKSLFSYRLTSKKIFGDDKERLLSCYWIVKNRDLVLEKLEFNNVDCPITNFNCANIVLK